MLEKSKEGNSVLQEQWAETWCFVETKSSIISVTKEYNWTHYETKHTDLTTSLVRTLKVQQSAKEK
jgi:hypothetical protein